MKDIYQRNQLIMHKDFFVLRYKVMLFFLNRSTMDTSRPSDELLECNCQKSVAWLHTRGLPFLLYKTKVKFCKPKEDD